MGGFKRAYLWGVEMKYEITKGSEKDFEGAPEWAMVILKHINNRRCVFAESKSQGAKRTEMYGDGECVIVSPNEYEIIAERRTITEPVVNQQLTTEWDGEGLPPAGVECEAKYRSGRSEWSLFKCVAPDKELAFGWSGDEPVILLEDLYEFRPIRSPDDVARDESTKAMNEVWREHAGKEHNGKLLSIYEIIYEGIAAGKIPGVKLE